MEAGVELERHEARIASSGSSSDWHLGILAGSIFLSAFLLFQVQPLISRWILPWFGGSTAVWTTCMLFFQIVLFGGYTYAHMMFRWLGPRRQQLVHLTFLAIACLVLPIIPADSWKPKDSAQPGMMIFLMLAATVGLPYFVLSSTGPLLQSWFARSYPGRSPYRLYALSNVGSLLALLSYPFVVEPLLQLKTQAWIWSGGFWLLALMIGYCAWKQAQAGNLKTETNESDAEALAVTQAIHPAPSLAVRGLWILLPALASVMLLAATNHICQSVAVIPFLWVAPLSLYLLTFILCFDSPKTYVRWLVALVTVICAFLSAGAVDIDFIYDLPLIPEISLYLATMFGCCFLCHGELVRLKPHSSYLTEFYLAMSAGGALGGLLVGFVAPRVFDSFLEWNLILLVTILLALIVIAQELAIFTKASPSRTGEPNPSISLVRDATLLLGGVGLTFASIWQFNGSTPLARTRNFYGVVSVQEYDEDKPDLHRYVFRSGRTDHGQQYRSPAKRDVPLTYYGRTSGVGRTIVEVGRRGPIRVGIVGLGTGSLATYARPGDYYRFYEINPIAVDVARKWFTFLEDCKGKVDVAEGDARLVLEREEDEPFDVLVLDAFSGGTVPVHLLTEEAFAIYRRRIREGGVIAVHVTNHFLQLATEVELQADRMGLSHTRLYRKNDEPGQRNNDWVLVTSDPGFLKAFPPEVPADVLEHESHLRSVPLWTDHYSNLFNVVKSW